MGQTFYEVFRVVFYCWQFEWGYILYLFIDYFFYGWSFKWGWCGVEHEFGFLSCIYDNTKYPSCIPEPGSTKQQLVRAKRESSETHTISHNSIDKSFPALKFSVILIDRTNISADIKKIITWHDMTSKSHHFHLHPLLQFHPLPPQSPGITPTITPKPIQ